MVGTIIILCGLFTVGLSNRCPSVQSVERMGTKTIICSHEGDIERCYWYLGSTSATDPILKVKNGVKGGTKLSDVHYDITSNCEMIITEAQLEHEATYTFVAFFSNGSYSTNNISVIVTVTPRTDCPRVSNCTICAKCSIKSQEDEKITLSCYVDGIRPSASLEWSHTGNVTVVRNSSQSVESNQTTNTWNSSATIEYSLNCGVSALLHCRGTGWTTNFSTTIQVISEMCEYDDVRPVTSSTAPPRNISPLRKSIMYWICPFAVIIAVIIVAIWYLRRLADTFCDELKNVYSANSVPEMRCLCSTFQCLVEDDNERTKSMTSDELLKDILQLKDSRVLFIGKSGYGKTFFLNTVLESWTKGDILPGVILIYIPFKFLTKTSSISKQLEEVLRRNHKFSRKLDNVLQQKECVLLLDGLTDLRPDEIAIENSHQFANEKKAILTVEDILQGESDNFPKLKVWVSSRPTENKLFKKPYRLIHLKGFNKAQTDKYLSRADEYYTTSETRNTSHAKTAPSSEESIPLIQDKNILDAWEKVYGTHGKLVSPLVAHLFALNFYKLNTAETFIAPNSKSQSEIRWDEKNSTFNVSHIDWHLFGCLLDSSNQDESKRILVEKLFLGRDVVFEKGKDGYHRDAVVTLCFSCKKLGVEPKSLTFCRDYPPSLEQHLPRIKEELIFKNLRLRKEDVITLLNNCYGKAEIVRFINCRLSAKCVYGLKTGDYQKVFCEKKNQLYRLDLKNKRWVEEKEVA